MTTLDKWSLFLRYAPDPKYRETVNKVIESEEVLTVAGELLMSISQNERERAIFRSRRKFQTDYDSDMATPRDNGIKEGKEIGIEIGRKDSQIEIARNLLKIDLALDQIAVATGLSIEEIEHLRIDEGE